jgi:hypothetical protein
VGPRGHGNTACESVLGGTDLWAPSVVIILNREEAKLMARWPRFLRRSFRAGSDSSHPDPWPCHLFILSTKAIGWSWAQSSRQEGGEGEQRDERGTAVDRTTAHVTRGKCPLILCALSPLCVDRFRWGLGLRGADFVISGKVTSAYGVCAASDWP